MNAGQQKTDANPSVLGFVAKNRLQPEIAAIREEYNSNWRLLSYFAQNNSRDSKRENLALLETALIRRQDMLLGKLTNLAAQSLEDVYVKLELWAEEAEENSDFAELSASTKIIHSVMEDVKRLSI